MSAGCVRCPSPATHAPCCSSHGHLLCCECYRRTHFIEVGPCCGQPSPPASLVGDLESLEAELHKLEATDPEVGAARKQLDRTVDRIVGRGPALSYEEVRRIYDPPCEAD